MMHLQIGIIASSAAGRTPNVLAGPTDLTNAAWVLNAVTRTANSMAETATTAPHFILQSNISYTAGQSWTLEVEAAPNGANCLQLTFGANAFGSLAFANFNLSTGVVGTVGAGATSASIAATDGGFHRCRITAPVTTTASGSGGVIAFCQGDSPTSARLASYPGSTSRSLLIRRADQFLL